MGDLLVSCAALLWTSTPWAGPRAWLTEGASVVQVALAVEPSESGAKASRGGECECDTTHDPRTLWWSFCFFLCVAVGQLAREKQSDGSLLAHSTCGVRRTCRCYLYKILH